MEKGGEMLKSALLVSGGLLAGAGLCYLSLRGQLKTVHLAEAHPVQGKAAQEGEYEEKLVREQLVRNYQFFGEENMAKIRGGFVVVVGCGGVGG